MEKNTTGAVNGTSRARQYRPDKHTQATPLLSPGPGPLKSVQQHDLWLERLGLGLDTRALISQHTQQQQALSQLLGGDPPRIELRWNEAWKAHVVWAHEPSSQDVEHLCALGEWLLDRKEPAALRVLIATAGMELKGVGSGVLHGLLLACAKALRYLPHPDLPASSGEALLALAKRCSDDHWLATPADDLQLFTDLAQGTEAPLQLEECFRHYEQFNPFTRYATILGWLGASADQVRELLAMKPQVVEKFAECFAGGSPAIMVSERGDPLHVQVQLPGAERPFKQLVETVRRLCDMAIPGAAAVFAALCLAARGHPQERALLRDCGRALLSSQARLTPGQLQALCQRALELAADEADPDLLLPFEQAAAYRKEPALCVRLQHRRLALEISRFDGILSAGRTQDIPGLVNDIRILHGRMRALGSVDAAQACAALLQRLLRQSSNGPHASLLRDAIDALRAEQDRGREQGLRQGQQPGDPPLN